MTKRCPLTYEFLSKEEMLYSVKGLKKLSPSLKALIPIGFSAEEILHEAAARAPKMSIQGVQPKLSLILQISKGSMEIVDTGGRFILKPPNPAYPELPENEDLTMHLANEAGLRTPDHGLLYLKDNRLSYFIRRFDRVGRTGKLATEDFSQLSGRTRETKYDSSMEQVAAIVEQYTTFPQIEKEVLYRMTLFAFLTGNEDMHLKNFSLITEDEVVKISPIYDQLNTSILLRDPEEFALPLNGKKRNLRNNELIVYYPMERLGLPARIVEDILESIRARQQNITDWITRSFLCEKLQEKYRMLIESRFDRLFK